MRKEWFEEVDVVGGKESRFSNAYYGTSLEEPIGDAIAHAFRTLLAEDAAAESSRVEPQPRKGAGGVA